MTARRVMPSSAPEEIGGVVNLPFFTIKMLSPVHSETKPWSLSMMPSSQPACRHSILAMMLLR
jgi:hypothetical protein